MSCIPSENGLKNMQLFSWNIIKSNQNLIIKISINVCFEDEDLCAHFEENTQKKKCWGGAGGWKWERGEELDEERWLSQILPGWGDGAGFSPSVLSSWADSFYKSRYRIDRCFLKSRRGCVIFFFNLNLSAGVDYFHVGVDRFNSTKFRRCQSVSQKLQRRAVNPARIMALARLSLESLLVWRDDLSAAGEAFPPRHREESVGQDESFSFIGYMKTLNL